MPIDNEEIIKELETFQYYSPELQTWTWKFEATPAVITKFFRKALAAKDAEWEKRIKDALPKEKVLTPTSEHRNWIKGFNNCRGVIIDKLNIK